MTPRGIRLVAVALLCGLVGFVVARRRASPQSWGPIWPDAVEARVPHATGMISLDGDTDDPGWKGPTLRTGAFVGRDGAAVHPHSEARVVWGDGFLYMNLYAADEDIQVRGRPPTLSRPKRTRFT